MKVQFVIGRAGSGKTTKCYEAIEEKLQEQEVGQLILLVPEQFNLQMQRDLSERLGKGLLKAEVLSFNTLAREVFKEVGCKKEKTIVEDLERMIILKRLMEAHKNDLVFYKKAINNTGFIEEINRFLTVIEQAGIGEEHLTKMQEGQEVSALFTSKLNDIETIYHAFKSYLGERFTTIESHMTLLAESISKSKKLEQAHIWVDGFYGFTFQQLLILRQLMKKVKQLTITLPMNEVYTKTQKVYKRTDSISPMDPFYESIRMFQHLMGICEEEQIAYSVAVTKAEESSHSKREALYYLEKNYLNMYQRAFPKPQENIYLTQYKSRSEEVEAIAQKIVMLVREQGYRYHDMAVVTGDLGVYQTLIENIFRAYGIPYFMDKNRNIHSNSLVAVIESLLEVMTSGYTYKSIMSLLRTYMLPLTKEEIDKLENYLLAYGIKGKKKWQLDWQYERDEAKQEEINQIKAKVLEPILAFEEELGEYKQKGGYIVRNITKALYSFLIRINAATTLEELAKHNKERGDLVKELENTQMWSKVMEVFERFVEILGEEVMSLMVYRKILITSFSYIKMGIIPPSRDQMIIGSAERTRLPSVKACFIIGVNEGILPKAEDNGSIFSEIDKMTLTQLCEKEEGPTARLGELLVKQPLYGATFTIYTVLTRATEKLFVSAAKADENGKLLRPSAVYFKLKKMFKEIERKEEREQLGVFEKPLPALSYVGEKMRAFVEGREEEETWKDALSYFNQSNEWQNDIHLLKEQLFFTNQQHYLKPETTEMIYGETLKTDISRLERFRQCACGYFIRYGLKAEERRLSSFDRAKVGTLFHAALEQYPKELKQIGTDWVEATETQQQQGIKRATEFALSKMTTAQRETGYFKFMASRVEKATKRAVSALTCHLKNGEFRPEGYEVGFGEGQEFPPIEMDLKDGKRILIRGQIDRIDVFVKNEKEKYVKILDYKSGQKNFSLLEVYYGLQLQLLLYLDAYLEKHPQSLAGGVFYFHINNPYITYKVGMNEEEIEKAEVKQFKLSGLVLEDPDIITALDREGKGVTISATLKKDGTVKKTSSAASKEQFAQLEQHIIETIKQLGEEILSGQISTKPIQLNGKNPCDYCAYRAICQFDEEMPDNCYDELSKLSNDQLWKAIEEEGK